MREGRGLRGKGLGRGISKWEGNRRGGRKGEGKDKGADEIGKRGSEREGMEREFGISIVLGI